MWPLSQNNDLVSVCWYPAYPTVTVWMTVSTLGFGLLYPSMMTGWTSSLA